MKESRSADRIFDVRLKTAQETPEGEDEPKKLKNQREPKSPRGPMRKVASANSIPSSSSSPLLLGSPKSSLEKRRPSINYAGFQADFPALQARLSPSKLSLPTSIIVRLMHFRTRK